MILIVNGETRDVSAVNSVADLLRHAGLAPERVAVELNESLVRRKEFAETPLHEHDRVEIVTFVGGG